MAVFVLPVLLIAVLIIPFVLEQVERRTVSAPAIVTHATRSRRTTPEVLEALVAVSLHETVAGVFGALPTRSPDQPG